MTELTCPGCKCDSLEDANLTEFSQDLWTGEEIAEDVHYMECSNCGWSERDLIEEN